MLGLTISLVFMIRNPIFYVLTLLVVLFALRWFIKKINAIGAADVNTINWVFLGYGIINASFLLWFVAVLMVVTLIYLSIKHGLLKTNKPTPFYPVLLWSFVINSWLFGLY